MFDGKYRSIKFAFIMFICNTIAKMVSLIYAAQMVIGESESYLGQNDSKRLHDDDVRPAVDKRVVGFGDDSSMKKQESIPWQAQPLEYGSDEESYFEEPHFSYENGSHFNPSLNQSIVERLRSPMKFNPGVSSLLSPPPPRIPLSTSRPSPVPPLLPQRSEEKGPNLANFERNC